jgi:hypothetical protein
MDRSKHTLELGDKMEYPEFLMDSILGLTSVRLRTECCC